MVKRTPPGLCKPLSTLTWCAHRSRLSGPQPEVICAVMASRSDCGGPGRPSLPRGGTGDGILGPWVWHAVLKAHLLLLAVPPRSLATRRRTHRLGRRGRRGRRHRSDRKRVGVFGGQPYRPFGITAQLRSSPATWPSAFQGPVPHQHRRDIRNRPLRPDTGPDPPRP